MFREVVDCPFDISVNVQKLKTDISNIVICFRNNARIRYICFYHNVLMIIIIIIIAGKIGVKGAKRVLVISVNEKSQF